MFMTRCNLLLFYFPFFLSCFHNRPFLTVQSLRTHLNKFSRKYDQLVAFKPTGWTFNQTVRVEDIQPQTQGNISIYGMCQSIYKGFNKMVVFI